MRLGIARCPLRGQPLASARNGNQTGIKEFPKEVARRQGFHPHRTAIVVAIIGIITAIAVPGFLRARMSGNEASSIGSPRDQLRRIDVCVELRERQPRSGPRGSRAGAKPHMFESSVVQRSGSGGRRT
jgi:hypothetical protein